MLEKDKRVHHPPFLFESKCKHFVNVEHEFLPLKLLIILKILEGDILSLMDLSQYLVSVTLSFKSLPNPLHS
jgi:hypothetical protein